MSIHYRKYLRLLVVILTITLACNVPLNTNSQNPPITNSSSIQSTSAIPSATVSEAPTQGQSGTTEAPVSIVAPVTHAATPAGAIPKGVVGYDVDSSGTASQNRAPYGDSYNLNLFERPFTQNTMTYIPALDINTFALSQDDTWDYVSLQMNGGDPNDKIGIDYGVELDTNHDGVGDYLVWAHPPYTTTWSTDTVQVYSDPNHDVGGASPEKSDANATTSAPYPGDGYETIIFNQGQGNDPDLAWVRLDPNNGSTVQFAFKISLAGHAFMWGVWADAGLKDPGKFNYNDRFTLEQAGSPIKGNVDYPIKAIYQVDNTCWAAFGFNPRGDEPHLCPPLTQPASTKAPKAPTVVPTSSCPPGKICVPICLSAGTMVDTPNGPVAVEDLRVGEAVWTATASGARVSSVILKTSRVSLPPGHPYIHVVLSDGRELWASPGHPTADGRHIGSLVVGDWLDGASIVKIETVLSDQPATYDLLPAGDTGDYWANGILIGSTLSNP